MYIMFLMVIGAGYGIKPMISQEFETKAACESAAEMIKGDFTGNMSGFGSASKDGAGGFVIKCYPKGDAFGS